MASLGHLPVMRNIKNDTNNKSQAFHCCQCGNKKIISKNAKSLEKFVLDTAFSQGVPMSSFSTIKLCGHIADFKVLTFIIEQICSIDKMQRLPDPKFFPLAEGFCESFVRLHPPCVDHTLEHYQELLYGSNTENTFTSLWNNMIIQLDFAAKNVLPESHPRRTARRKYSEEYSPDFAELVQKMEVAEETVSKKCEELLPADKLAILFVPFSVFVLIFEKDFEVWTKRHVSGLPHTKFYRPLIVQLFWKDERQFDQDAILNKQVRQIFKFYIDCAHNRVSRRHLKVVARLINLLSDMVDLVAKHHEAKPGVNLAADFRNFHFQPRLKNNINGFALKEIENGRIKVPRPVLHHCLDDTAVMGSLCKVFASVFASALGRCTCEDEKECLAVEKALIFIKPPWLVYITISSMLKQDSEISVLKATAKEALSDGEELLSQTQRFRRIFVSSAKDTLQMLGYRTSRSRKDVRRASKRIKLDPTVKNTDDIEGIITLIKSQNINLF